MKSARRFTLKARLLVSFGLIMALMLLTGVFAVSRISSENSQVNDVATTIVPATSLAGQAAAYMNKYRKDQLHYILSTPAARAGSQGVDGDLAGDLSGIAQLLSKYGKQGLYSDAHDRRLVENFKTLFYRYVQQSGAFRRLADAGRIQQAGNVVGAGVADNTYTSLKAASTAWTSYEQTLANAAA